MKFMENWELEEIIKVYLPKAKGVYELIDLVVGELMERKLGFKPFIVDVEEYIYNNYAMYYEKTN